MYIAAIAQTEQSYFTSVELLHTLSTACHNHTNITSPACCLNITAESIASLLHHHLPRLQLLHHHHHWINCLQLRRYRRGPLCPRGSACRNGPQSQSWRSAHPSDLLSRSWRSEHWRDLHVQHGLLITNHLPRFAIAHRNCYMAVHHSSFTTTGPVVGHQNCNDTAARS